MTYITEALYAEEPEAWAAPENLPQSLTEEDFLEDEKARDRYEIYTEEEGEELALHEVEREHSAADTFGCSEEDLQDTMEYAQNHMEAYE